MVGTLASFQARLLRWYRARRRDLPWRVPLTGPPDALPDPYHVLVSETMLQQTQVATVIPYFHRFLAELPTLQRLARADEQQILRLWQGLGYYSRARNLQKAAAAILRDHDGVIPRTVEQLLQLPGIGRYTAGAIASLAFNAPASILDGNVIRVICRLDARSDDTRRPSVREALWQRASDVLARRHPGDFNSAMMELGATICTPHTPRCPECPVRRHCQALAEGTQEQLPRKSPARARPIERRWILCIEHQGRYLLEQRPARGRWARMWQFVTIPADSDSAPTPRQIHARLGLTVTRPRRLGRIDHDLTHRRYEFMLLGYRARSAPAIIAPRVWCSPEEVSSYPLPKPHVTVVEILTKKIA